MTITDVIMKLINEYDQDSFFINCGLCEDFAADVIERAGIGELIWLDDIDPSPESDLRWRRRQRVADKICHAVVLHNGKYYAECPQGVSD